MMRISASSVLMTLFTVFIMVIVLDLLLKKPGSHKLFRADFITVYVWTALARLCVPAELFFTRTFTSLRKVMNPVMDFLLRTEITEHVMVYQCLLSVWAAGTVVSLVILLVRYIKAEQSYHQIISCCEQSEMTDGIPVYTGTCISEPMVFGFHKAILLPDIEMDHMEYDYVIRHELRHIRNHDGMQRVMVNLICCIYWWYLPVYVLRKDFILYQEIHVDDQITKDMANEQVLEYASVLVETKRKLKNQTYISSALCMVGENEKILSYRIDYLLKGTFRKKTPTAFLVFVWLVPFLSNMVIFEPHYDVKESQILSENQMEQGVLIHKEDGTWTFLIDGTEYEVEDPSWDLWDKVKVIEE